MNDRAKEILDFWFDDMVVEKRFKRDDNFDQVIKNKFKGDHDKAISNEYDDWQDEPLSTLALVILLDTFKMPLSSVFPGLENVLQNLNETLKDIFLFFKDLVI